MKNYILPIAALAVSLSATAAEPPSNLPIGSRDGIIYRVSDLQTSTVENQVTVAATSTNLIDFALAPIQLVSLTTNVTVGFSNLSADRTVTTIYYNPLGTTNTIAFPSGIVWTANPITNLLNGKRAVITFYATGTSNETVVATVHRQP